MGAAQPIDESDAAAYLEGPGRRVVFMLDDYRAPSARPNNGQSWAGVGVMWRATSACASESSFWVNMPCPLGCALHGTVAGCAGGGKPAAPGGDQCTVTGDRSF